MSTAVSDFYDNFSKRLLRDYIDGNIRVERQLEFFKNAIPKHTSRILVVGCGTGKGAYFVATRLAKKAQVVAIDISPENIKIAQRLFRHNRVEYRTVDVTKESVGHGYDVILLPDVYEHIPLESRKSLHTELKSALSQKGRVLLTFPSSGHQEQLRAKGVGLQIIDETVTLEDIIGLAKDIGGELTYFSLVSVAQTNDYVHAMIESNIGQLRSLTKEDRLPIKGLKQKNIIKHAYLSFSCRVGPRKFAKLLRRFRVYYAFKHDTK